MDRVAFITGGNGITGSAILDYLCSHTARDKWSQFIVTSRSPFECNVKDDRIVFVPLDFTNSSTVLKDHMSPLCAKVTHAYFSSYIHHDDFNELARLNNSLFENFLDALVQVAPSLENVTLQTGGKYYNLHLQPVPYPTHEDQPRCQTSVDNFYYAQEDFLASRQKDQHWSYNVIRPQAIIGTSPRPNGMNQALTLALYFLICKELGSPAPMPTNQRFWATVDENSYAPLIADLTIYASTKKHCANEAFNMVNGDTFCWRYLWPQLAGYFGVQGCSSDQEFTHPVPTEGQVQQEFDLVTWSKDKQEVWTRLCEEAGVPQASRSFAYGTWGYQDWVFQRSWGALLSMSKARRFGWNGYKDTFECLVETFEALKKQGLIPNH